MNKECFIVENGVERKAGLEDLIPIIVTHRWTLQHIIREAVSSRIGLSTALAFLPDEIKETVYRNVSPRTGYLLKKEVSYAETGYIDYFVAKAKAKLIGLIGEQRNFSFPENIIWREAVLKEANVIETPPLEFFTKRIEESFDSGDLRMGYCTDKINQEEIQNVFQNHLDDLHKIRYLEISGKDLPAAALLFEKAKIEKLTISGAFDCVWPPFLENCPNLTVLTLAEFSKHELTELPSWIHNASSLRDFSVKFMKIASLPDWIGDLQSLITLSLYNSQNLETLPDSIGNLKNLDKLDLSYSGIKKLLDGIGNLQSLTELRLDGNRNLETLPDSIGNLKNLAILSLDGTAVKTLPDSMGNLKTLQRFSLDGSPIGKIPDWIGDLQSLTMLSLCSNKNLKALPDSIGLLKNLTALYLSDSPIDKISDTIVNCTALETVDIFGTKINSVPDFLGSIKSFNDNTVIDVIPQGKSISYKCFCNSYYMLAKTILRFHDKARREGLLAMEEDLYQIAEGFFKEGIRLVVDGTDGEIIRDIMRIKSDREHDFYRKKLMEAATESILCIYNGDTVITIVGLLASLVDIKNNPLDTACVKYVACDFDAMYKINFDAAIEPEEEREEIRFIKRALKLSELSRREGLLALEEHIDPKGIASRDVFEYGLPLAIDGWDPVVIRKILDNLIAHETDPVRKNIAQAKEEAVLSIYGGDNPRVLVLKLYAFFDEDIAGEIRDYYESREQ